VSFGRRYAVAITATGYQDENVKILIIEDEPKVAAYMRKGLIEQGFTVDVVNDGTTGLHHVTTSAYDLAVVDVALPFRDGWSIVERMRETGVTTPVLFVTARDAVEDRVRGLELGGDDYLVKPFAFSEFLARVRALLRRGTAQPIEQIQVADLSINLLRRRAERGGRRLDLSPQEFLLLSLLARRAGEVLTRSIIAEQVWDMNFDSDTNIVDVAIRRLRAKVDAPFGRQLIHTVRGVGYVLEEREDIS
jgi:two-component system, OmpR family, copper resistance phosphate regulon response regulator CusR